MFQGEPQCLRFDQSLVFQATNTDGVLMAYIHCNISLALSKRVSRSGKHFGSFSIFTFNEIPLLANGKWVSVSVEP